MPKDGSCWQWVVLFAFGLYKPKDTPPSKDELLIGRLVRDLIISILDGTYGGFSASYCDAVDRKRARTNPLYDQSGNLVTCGGYGNDTHLRALILLFEVDILVRNDQTPGVEGELFTYDPKSKTGCKHVRVNASAFADWKPNADKPLVIANFVNKDHYCSLTPLHGNFFAIPEQLQQKLISDCSSPELIQKLKLLTVRLPGTEDVFEELKPPINGIGRLLQVRPFTIRRYNNIFIHTYKCTNYQKLKKRKKYNQSFT